MLAGHVIEGGCVSFTVTVNEQLAWFPLASVAVQVVTALPLASIWNEASPTAGVVPRSVSRNSQLVTVRLRLELPLLVIVQISSRESKNNEFENAQVPVKLSKRTSHISRPSTPDVFALVWISVCCKVRAETALPENPSLPRCPVMSTLSRVSPDELAALMPSAPEF